MVGKHKAQFANKQYLLEEFQKTVPRGQPSCVALREVTISEAPDPLICKMKRLGQVTS